LIALQILSGCRGEATSDDSQDITFEDDPYWTIPPQVDPGAPYDEPCDVSVPDDCCAQQRADDDAHMCFDSETAAYRRWISRTGSPLRRRVRSATGTIDLHRGPPSMRRETHGSGSTTNRSGRGHTR